MKRYNVLWLEDEPEKNPVFLDRAEVDGIDLIHVYTVKDFKEEFTKKIRILDAVVLDGKGVMESLEETPSLEALNKALAFINEKKHIKCLQPFILSAHLGKDENKSAREMLKGEKIYIKSEEEVTLILAIKEAADQQQEAQIQYKYSRVFEVCGDKYLGSKLHETLIDLFKRVEAIEKSETTKDNLITVRKIIENLVDKLYEYNCVPKEIYEGGFNPSVKFICNIKNGSKFTLVKNYMHLTLGYIFDNLVFVIQDSQHDKKNLKLYVDEYITQIKSPYLFKSLVFQLMDILIWFKNFIDQNPDPEENKKLWVEIDNNIVWIKGIVINVSPDGFAFFKPNGAIKDCENIYIHKKDVLNFKLTNDQPIYAESISFTDANGTPRTQIKNINLIVN